MADAKIYGVNVAGILATARAQAEGSQKASYFGGIAAAYGSAPKLEVRIGSARGVGGSLKYAATFTGPLVGSATGIALPALNAPTTNVADAVTSAAEFVISSTTETTRRMVVPVSSLVVTGALRLSPPLDGTSPIALALSGMLPPPGLDAAATTPPPSDYTAIADRIINLMGTFNDDELAGVTVSGQNAWWSRPISDMQAAGHSTHAAVIHGAEPTYANSLSWVRQQIDSVFAAYKNDEWNRFLNWFVVCDGKLNNGHRATNTGVRLSQYETWTRHQDTKVWTRRVKGAISDGSYGYKPSLTGDAGAITWRDSGAYREMYVPDKTQLTNRGPHPYGNFVTLADYASFDCVVVAVKASLIVWDATKTDDRSSANLLFQIGGDYYPATLSGPAPGWLPGFGGTKFAQITPTEQWFGAACLTNARKEYVSAAGCAISTAEFRNNPPPIGS